VTARQARAGAYARATRARRPLRAARRGGHGRGDAGRYRRRRCPGFLVFFVTDAVDDELASAVRTRIRAAAGDRPWVQHAPGFFDDPDPGGGVRTTGGYLRIESPCETDALALLGVATDVAEDHAVHRRAASGRSACLGHVRAGDADSRPRDAVRDAGAG
jgi:hypothetical protein